MRNISLDPASQRRYVISAFAVLQAVKIYDILQAWGSTGISDIQFVLKWSFIDGLCLYILPKLQIPWLSFGPFVNALLVTAAFVLNIILSFGVSSILSINISALWSAILSGL